jgi:hypothetical protein
VQQLELEVPLPSKMRRQNIGIKKTVIKNPDIVELGLISVLVVWSISAFMLLQQAANLGIASGLLSWTSLIAFFTGMCSVILIVIAIIVANIRKELVK